jgi:hypothetical protein
VQPIAILGLKTDQNSYLDSEGRWKARYLPAFVRRYPFVFSQSNEPELIHVHLQSMRNLSTMLPRAAAETTDIDAAMEEAGLTRDKPLH